MRTKQMHERLAAERHRLLAAERAARLLAEAANLAKDEFLAVVSHELRTPLNAMLGWLQLLREGKLDPAKKERALAVVQRSAVAQQKLIEDILDASRIISNKLTIERDAVDFAAIVRTGADALRPEAENKGLRFEVDIAPSFAGSGDAHRLEQVVRNLLANAVKFTPAGGTVSVRAHAERDDLVLRVEDTGIGIDPAFLSQVFERFRQADSSTTRSHGGLGLGLAIVRQVVELHGGRVEAQSDGRDTGATFIVRIPMNRASGADSAPEGGEHESVDPDSNVDLTGLLVLLVDDEADSREFAFEVLTARGARVVSVASAAEALDALHATRPHVLVSDIGMPGQDGLALARQLRSLGIEVPALALTAYASSDDRARALEAGFVDHVHKPVRAGTLVRAVHRLGRRVES